MVDARWDGLWAPDRPEDDVVLGDRRDRPRRTGTVWVTGGYTREAVLGALLESGHPMSAGEILDVMYRRRIRVGQVADPRKAVSDVLRYQLGKNRVRRVGFGRYVAARIPRSTDYRMRRRFVDRSWPWAFWEVADSRPALDVPLPPGACGGGGGAGPVTRDRPPPPVLSGAWPSDS